MDRSPLLARIRRTSYTIQFADLPQGITGFRLEVMPDDSLPKKGPGRAGNGNFVLSEFIAEVTAKDKPPQTDAAGAVDEKAADAKAVEKLTALRKLKFTSAAASYEQTGATGGNPYGKWAVAAAIDDDAKGAKWGWAVMEQVGRRHFAFFQLNSDQDASLAADQRLTITLQQYLDNPQHTIGRFPTLVHDIKVCERLRCDDTGRNR